MATNGERNAITKALLLGGSAVVRRVRYGVYAVASASRPGVAHTVTIEAGAYRCDCEAGRHGKPCWHAAAVYVAKVEHASGGRVTGPAALASAATGPGFRGDRAGAPAAAGRRTREPRLARGLKGVVMRWRRMRVVKMHRELPRLVCEAATDEQAAQRVPGSSSTSEAPLRRACQVGVPNVRVVPPA
jgi:SWIM zinc finger